MFLFQLTISACGAQLFVFGLFTFFVVLLFILHFYSDIVYIVLNSCFLNCVECLG